MSYKKLAIVDSLENLSKMNYDKFCMVLMDGHGGHKVSRGKVEGKNVVEVTNVLASTFTEKRAVAVTCRLLTLIGCVQEAKELDAKIAKMSSKAHRRQEKYDQDSDEDDNDDRRMRKEVAICEEKLRRMHVARRRDQSREKPKSGHFAHPFDQVSEDDEEDDYDGGRERSKKGHAARRRDKSEKKPKRDDFARGFYPALIVHNDFDDDRACRRALMARGCDPVQIVRNDYDDRAFRRMHVPRECGGVQIVRNDYDDRAFRRMHVPRGCSGVQIVQFDQEDDDSDDDSNDDGDCVDDDGVKGVLEEAASGVSKWLDKVGTKAVSWLESHTK
ncbi:uncharacterized protein LOC144023037 [Festucalex cinctus]